MLGDRVVNSTKVITLRPRQVYMPLPGMPFLLQGAASLRRLERAKAAVQKGWTLAEARAEAPAEGAAAADVVASLHR